VLSRRWRARERADPAGRLPLANAAAADGRGVVRALMGGGLPGPRIRCGRATRPRARQNEGGQAAVELVAGLPALLLVGVVVMQLLAVGYTAVLAGDAAEAGALAMARGAAPDVAARAAIPGWAREGMQVGRAVG